MTILTLITQACLNIATSIMPPERKDWSLAMIGELEALSTPLDKCHFAFGYLKTSFAAFARTPTGVSVFGRIIMGTGFFGLALWCLYIGVRLGSTAQTINPAFLLLSGLYASLGFSIGHAAISATRLSMIGATFAALTFAALILKLLPVTGNDYLLAKALSLEVVVILIVSSILTKWLSVLDANSPENRFIA